VVAAAMGSKGGGRGSSSRIAAVGGVGGGGSGGGGSGDGGGRGGGCGGDRALSKSLPPWFDFRSHCLGGVRPQPRPQSKATEQGRRARPQSNLRPWVIMGDRLSQLGPDRPAKRGVLIGDHGGPGPSFGDPSPWPQGRNVVAGMVAMCRTTLWALGWHGADKEDEGGGAPCSQ